MGVCHVFKIVQMVPNREFIGVNKFEKSFANWTAQERNDETLGLKVSFGAPFSHCKHYYWLLEILCTYYLRKHEKLA